jgi:hypothetical protein
MRMMNGRREQVLIYLINLTVNVDTAGLFVIVRRRLKETISTVLKQIFLKRIVHRSLVLSDGRGYET